MMSVQKPLKMYNLNVNVATTLGAAGLLGIEGQCTTPRTPEILNSLIAMTNPFDSLGKTGQENTSPLSVDSSCASAGSPAGSPTTSPPSIQHTCSQLIKEGLKLTLQSKRKLSGSDSRDEFEDFPPKRSKSDELTAEDEERRKRRRERNKIAATKCRMKKRERTANLVTEAEVVEAQNIEIKAQIQDLEKQRLRLMNMLSQHAPHCQRNQQQQQQQQHQHVAAAPANHGFETFTSSAVADAFLEADFAEDTGLLPYSKDPNFGKFIDNMYVAPQVQGKGQRKNEGLFRGSYHCEEEDPDVYRPNGVPVDTSFFSANDSGYSSFSTGQMDPGCRA